MIDKNNKYIINCGGYPEIGFLDEGGNGAGKNNAVKCVVHGCEDEADFEHMRVESPNMYKEMIHLLEKGEIDICKSWLDID